MNSKHLARLLVVFALLLIPAGMNKGFAQSNAGKTVTVTVTDDIGPVLGAGVIVKGTTSGSITDLNGKAVLSNLKDGSVLEVSCLGYLTQEIKADKSEILVTLVTDSQVLDDVVVIGYGTAKRKDFTGSVSSVRLEDSPIAMTNNLNALESIKGNIPGLDVGATNSAGGSPSMQIRGQKSISGSNDPLIVIDGVIFLGSLNDINPNDIASFDILKDATSAAAYGSRSANGVIIITTKKGRTQKPTFSFNTSGSVQLWANRPEVQDVDQWIKTTMARMSATDLSWLTPQEQANLDAGKSTDWLDMVSRTGFVQDHQLSVSGAGNKVNYYISASYSQNRGIVVGDDYSRISALAKVSADITDWMQIGLDASFADQDWSGAGASISRAYEESPLGVPFRDEAGTLLEKYPDTQGSEHPLWGVTSGTRDNMDKTSSYRMNAFALIKCPWVKGLSYRVNFSANRQHNESHDFYYESHYVVTGAASDDSRYSSAAYQNLLPKANGAKNKAERFSWVLDHILNYNQEFGKHSVDLTAVATRDRKTYNYMTIEGTDFSENGNTSLGINGLPYSAIHNIKQGGDERANIGYLARGMYSYDDRYFVTASYRRDGASVFGKDKKWGNYYAAGLAWKLTNEAFMPKNEILTNMKIKASWGVNGNQSISPFGTYSTMDVGKKGGTMYEFGDDKILYGITTGALGNSELGWEETTAWNLGFESAWLNDRIFLDVDAYVSQTRNQIFTRTIPVMTGFPSIKATMGQVNNRGLEITLKSVNIRRKDFNWNTSLMFWINRNKLVSLYGEDLDKDGFEDDDITNNLFIGKHLGAIYGYRQDGVIQEDDHDYIFTYGGTPGYPKYVDISGPDGKPDGKINDLDREILGYSSPNFRLNMSNTFNYKNFELYFMFTGTFGGNGFYQKSNTGAYQIYSSMSSNNRIYTPWWTPENRSNKYLSPKFAGDGRFLGLQSRSFVRLQDVTLSYNFRGQKIKDFGISGLKLFLSGKNLLTFTKWDGDDPETGAGVGSGTYPVISSITFGANLNF